MKTNRAWIAVPAAVLVVVGAVAATKVATNDGDATPAERRPTTPTPTPSATPTAAVSPDAIISSGDFVSYAIGRDGTVLTTWRTCDDDTGRCRSAWQLRTADGVRRGLAAPMATGVRAGDVFVLSDFERYARVLRPDGTLRPITRVAQLVPRPGDTFFNKVHGLQLVDADRAQMARLPDAPGTVRVDVATIAADGTVVGIAAQPPIENPPGTWVMMLHGATWSRVPLSDRRADGPLPGFVVTSGDHLAAMSTYDGATVAPVGTFGVSSDSGRSWTRLHKGDVPFATVDSVAATSTGTLYVATPEGALYRSAGQDWTTFVRVDVAGRVGQIQPAGREVAGLTGDYPDLHLLLFDGSGRHRDLGGLR
jgi:hypothetical protein